MLVVVVVVIAVVVMTLVVVVVVIAVVVMTLVVVVVVIALVVMTLVVVVVVTGTTAVKQRQQQSIGTIYMCMHVYLYKCVRAHYYVSEQVRVCIRYFIIYV